MKNTLYGGIKMIEVKNLTKCYAAHKAIDNISFTVNDGEILGFLGPNGAGKSTTMNIITGYLSATDGSVSVGGFDILENPDDAKRHIGYLPEHPPLYMDMTVGEYLNFMYDLKKVRLPRKAHLREICNLVKINDVYDRVIKHLSKGYRQRVGIAQALIGNPEVLILDEPTVGLDPRQIVEIRKLIIHLGRNHTVILSSHILSDVQAVCERIIVINNGRLIADASPDDLSKSMSNDNSLVVRVRGPEHDVHKIIRAIPGVSNVTALTKREKNAFEFKVEVSGDADIRPEMFKRLAERNWPILMLKPYELSLEDVFMRLTDGTSDGSEFEALNKPAKKLDEQTEADIDNAINQLMDAPEPPLNAPSEHDKEEQ